MWYDSYRPAPYNQTFDVPDGDHPVTIVKGEATQTKGGKGMIAVTLKCRDAAGVYVERYVEGEWFDGNMTRFFDAFKIRRGDFNFAGWAGRGCMAHFVHKDDEYVDSSGTRRQVKRCTLQYLVVDTDGDVEPPAPASASVAPSGYAGAGRGPYGGPDTPAQKERIEVLLGAAYPDGARVFSADECADCDRYRLKRSADELIAYLESELRSRNPLAMELLDHKKIPF